MLLVEHIQAFMGEFSYAFVLCYGNIAATVWRPAWKAVKPLHSVFQLTSLRALLWNGFLNIYSIINNDKKEVHWRTLQLHFEGLHREQLILFSVFQPTSLRSQLWNGFINVYSIINNDKKKSQSSTFDQTDQTDLILSNSMLMTPSPIWGRHGELAAKAKKDFSFFWDVSLRELEQIFFVNDFFCSQIWWELSENPLCHLWSSHCLLSINSSLLSGYISKTN